MNITTHETHTPRFLSAAVVRLLACVLCVALLLSGCAIGEPTPTPSVVAPTATLRPTSPPPTATARPTAAPQATVASQPLEPPGSLVLWTTEQGPALEFVRQLAATWGQRDGLTINVIGKSSDGIRTDLIAADLVDGDTPDLFWGNQDDLAGLLADDRLQPFGTAESAGTFIPATVSSATLDGRLWGLPIAVQGELLLLYNKGLVGQPPATTDELIVQARNAQKPRDDQYGLVAGWSAARWTVALLTGFGGSVLDTNGATPTLNTPQMLSALNLLRELRASGPPAPSTYTQGSRLFARGQVALAIDGDWSLATYRAASDTLDLGVAPLPRVPATGRLAAPPLGGTYLMFGKHLAGDKLAQAQTFGAFLTTTDQQVAIATALGRLPALRVALAAPAITSDPTLVAAAQQTEGASGLPPTKALRCAWDAIDMQLPALLTNEQNQEQAADAMQRAAEACIAAP